MFLSLDLCDRFLIIRLRVHAGILEVSPLQRDIFLCNFLVIYAEMSGSPTIFYPIVLPFIDDPFLNHLLQWWLQNGEISTT